MTGRLRHRFEYMVNDDMTNEIDSVDEF